MFGNHDCVSQITLSVCLLISPKSSKKYVFLSKSHTVTTLVYHIHQGAYQCQSQSLFLQDWPVIPILSWSCFFSFFLYLMICFKIIHTCQPPQASWLKPTCTSCYFSYFIEVLLALLGDYHLAVAHFHFVPAACAYTHSCFQTWWSVFYSSLSKEASNVNMLLEFPKQVLHSHSSIHREGFHISSPPPKKG